MVHRFVAMESVETVPFVAMVTVTKTIVTVLIIATIYFNFTMSYCFVAMEIVIKAIVA